MICKKTLVGLVAAGLILILATTVSGQSILLDKPVTAGDLTCFPDVNDSLKYYYLPDQIRLATHSDGTPQFSFLRFVRNVATTGGSETITEGIGGSIVHAVVSLDVTPDQLNEARSALASTTTGAQIVGPVIYESGTIALISSVANEEGEYAEKVLGLGKAPLLDGQKAAVSLLLTKEGGKILWESFKTSTPDMTFSFEMQLSGYRSPVNATITADYDRIYSHKSFELAATTPILAAEIKAAYDDLYSKNVIKVEQVGSDAKMEELLTTAYNKLTEMIFAPVGGTGTPNLSQLQESVSGGKSMLDRATDMLSKARAEAKAEARDAKSSSSSDNTTTASTDKETSKPNISNANTSPRSTSPHAANAQPSDPPTNDPPAKPSFAVGASFQFKKVRQHGEFRLSLNKTTTGNLTLRFDENIGQIDCPECFREVNLDDQLYSQREVFAVIDGLNLSDFSEYVNSVIVTLHKLHQSGSETLKEVKILGNTFSSDGNFYPMTYGFKDDVDRDEWLKFEYRTVWSFIGGHEVTSDWVETDIAGINLAPPYCPRTIDIDTDREALEAADVRAVRVILYYSLGGADLQKEVVLRSYNDEFAKAATIIMPVDDYEYDYQIEWIKHDGSSVTSNRMTSSSSILFADVMPG